MNSDFVIRVDGLGKSYTVHHQEPQRYTALRDVWARQAKAVGRFFNPFTLLGQFYNPHYNLSADQAHIEDDFWALRDVSFELQRGERVGIIGSNGAGKSTLLKILSRITEPTTGRVEICGRVASLLEVGTGFHPELTGRENIYLNGAILGMSRREVRSKFTEIVEFAEVEKFLDVPVKRYSSGMYVRLAFAVAAHLEPDILVVDEVLAVGDARFQKKCLGKMEDVADQDGRTVLFVSHSMAAVSELCSRVIYMRDGTSFMDGDSTSVIRHYLQSGASRGTYINLAKSKADAYVSRAEMKVEGVTSSFYQNNGGLSLELDVQVNRDCICSIELILRSEDGSPIMFWAPAFTGHRAWSLSREDSRTAIINIVLPELARGTYSIDVILAEPGIRFIENLESCLEFEVNGSSLPLSSWQFMQSRKQGCLMMDATFAPLPFP